MKSNGALTVDNSAPFESHFQSRALTQHVHMFRQLTVNCEIFHEILNGFLLLLLLLLSTRVPCCSAAAAAAGVQCESQIHRQHSREGGQGSGGGSVRIIWSLPCVLCRTITPPPLPLPPLPPSINKCHLRWPGCRCYCNMLRVLLKRPRRLLADVAAVVFVVATVCWPVRVCLRSPLHRVYLPAPVACCGSIYPSFRELKKLKIKWNGCCVASFEKRFILRAV